ncbi:MAG: S1 RNA-binding domain-containing protein, partial [Bacteriovoracia bacterium]
EHCSYRERLSGETEMESRKLKQVRLMMKELGNEFEGMINGTHKKGIFVQLAAPYVEGFIPIETLTDDDYLFNEEHLFLYGRRKKRMFRVGDRLRVQVVNASLEMRRIEFELLEKLEEAPSATPARQKKPR